MALSLGNITIDCHDAAALAGFYAQLFERPVDPGANEHFATIDNDAATPTFMFIAVPDKNPGKNVIHLDLHSPDQQTEIQKAVALGAKHLADYDEYGVKWATLSDPEGNLFDIAQD
ncbi:VOC family protein [Nocardia yunnanensis]|uniref:VOC family protein n=1 Tax=Nocardia yunnanensis TaxID=2382165 RepID=A0A386ZI24_9NOCA|nr:VOC family protein [Nocardia yunnanensis]AYF77197.1 VOC family protein [Nocardia yunnanensis]